MSTEPGIASPLLEILSATYTPEGCRIWWSTRNRGLASYTPQESWALRPDLVLAVARRIEGS